MNYKSSSQQTKHTQEKNPGSVKKWKVPGKLYNYGKTSNLEEKKTVYEGPWWISTTKSSMFSWRI